MTDSLPIITKPHAVNTTTTPASSLLGRGLVAIQRKETGVVLSDLDSSYRKARDIYNRITHYGRETRFKPELLPTQEELLKEPLLEQLQPLYTMLQQLAETFKVFQQLANQGYSKAYLPLAKMYEGGQGIGENIEKAEYYADLACNYCWDNFSDDLELSDLELFCDYGYCQYSWVGDDMEAVRCYLAAAERGDANGQYELIRILRDYECNGDDNSIEYEVDQYYEGFFDDYLKASAEHGHVDAQFDLGNKDKFCYKFEEAVFWYSKAAEQGYAKAQYNLGLIYDGKDDFPNVEEDKKQAVFWYRQAAERGHADAQFNLGYLYEMGRGIERNYEQAVFWYRTSAEQGHANAQYNLGWLYEKGRGVEQDNKQVVFWYRKAAKQRNIEAQIYLKKRGINWQES